MAARYAQRNHHCKLRLLTTRCTGVGSGSDDDDDWAEPAEPASHYAMELVSDPSSEILFKLKHDVKLCGPVFVEAFLELNGLESLIDTIHTTTRLLHPSDDELEVCIRAAMAVKAIVDHEVSMCVATVCVCGSAS